MRKITLSITILLFISSCSSGLYKTKQLNLENEGVYIKTYHLDEFDIYTYSICEDTREEINNNRFSNCAENFYDVAENDTLIKVEEVYLLRHRPSDVVIYITTDSDKYLKYQEGFLNDRSIYEDNIILNKVEFAYIGNIDTDLNWIHFPNQDNGQDVILHYNPKPFPIAIELVEANIATAENNYTTDEKINLNQVFSEPIAYKKSNYAPKFFKKKVGNSKAYLPKCLNILSRKGKIEVVFGCCEGDELFFKIGHQKVRYNTNFFTLPE